MAAAAAAVAKFGGKAAPVDPTKIPAGIDSTTFFTPQIPDEVRAVVSLFHAFSFEIIRAALELVRRHLTVEPISDEEFIQFQMKLKQQGPDFGSLFTGIYSIIRQGVYSKLPAQKLNTDLKAMNVPVDVADEITRVITASRQTLESQAIVNRSGFSHLHKLRWRIDVTISSGSLSRVMRPSILMQLILKDGTVKSFEVSIEQFNQLRYSVAKVLHDMRSLERHPIMKIIREFERKEDERNR